MAKFKKEEETKKEMIIPMSDIKRFRDFQRDYPWKSGNKLTTRERFLIHMDAAKETEGGLAVTDPELFTIWNRVADSCETYDTFRNEEIRRSVPGEQEAHQSRLKRFSQEIRRIMGSKTIKHVAN